MRSLVLFVFVVLPGVAFSSISVYYLFPEWVTLDAVHKNYQQVVKSPSVKVSDLLVAEAAENRHRINCFAEGVGVLLGGVIAVIGIHGICTLPNKTS
ncbi:MAG: hypothetical protein KME28_28015 [Pelatocladus maniniholoensis HA4357-MV3]|uniref:Uncharacterized protein n=1 Tax=Pelatocladus maniniholoensis HA4357-MV3 TaxID=1117104 RepID=A0A9E3LW43_9NOST|nr:hypothetical protein [Pelatocladus maniniholoensis HA4357-MV3]BAZ67320.1 hypothetical protein NIES4106_20750 [Fischerella sp. NIES-4106]